MYKIEVRLASRNGYHTPAEAKKYYGRYSRDGVTIHHWNSKDKVKDSDHDNIVNYILGKASRGEGSVNYVLSNKKITLVVNPDNVAWASQSGNPTTVSVEFSPHLSTEGYKKAGWLINELFNKKDGRYKKSPKLWKHSDFFQTQCPGTLSTTKMLTQAKKWANGDYDPKPPKPVPPKEDNLTWHLWKEGETEYEFNKDTYLYDVNTKTWGGIKKVKAYKEDDRVVIVGHIHNKALNRDYYITRYTFDNKKTTGFHPADLEVYVAPRPTPKPPENKPNPPVEPTDPVNWGEENNNLLKQILTLVQWVVDKLKGVFK